MITAMQSNLEAVSLQCLISVIKWFTAIPLMFIMVLALRWLFIKFKDYESVDEWDDGMWVYGIPCLILGLCLGCTAIAFICTIPYWNFIGVNHPDIYMVHLSIDRTLSN